MANTAWYLSNFRSSLMERLMQCGHTVIAVAPADDKYSRYIESLGVRFTPVPMNRKGVNPFEDLLLILRLIRLFFHERPDFVLTYTPKPNIYASIAARFFKIRVVNNVSGLGNLFVARRLMTTLVETLYGGAFKRSHRVFFQNNDDLSLFLEKRLVPPEVSERIPGSGVDTKKFVPRAKTSETGTFVFLLVARMLWDKGIGELVEASRQLLPRYPNMKCKLVGFIDSQNPAGIPEHQLKQWHDEGLVVYHGSSDNIADILQEADCVVLPSCYREGVPRSLLEAASMAKPIITTDAVGCRDTIDDGITGYLCKAKDAKDLAVKMEKMMLLPEQERLRMGLLGREKMLREFDESLVLQRYLDVIEKDEMAVLPQSKTDLRPAPYTSAREI